MDLIKATQETLLGKRYFMILYILRPQLFPRESQNNLKLCCGIVVEEYKTKQSWWISKFTCEKGKITRYEKHIVCYNKIK